MTAGIYQVENQVNRKRYIGSALDLVRRWREHRRDLSRGTHHNRHLQRAWDKYGGEAFEFSVLEEVKDPDRLLLREQHFLDTLSPEYNILPIAGSNLGWVRAPRSEETRRKISEALKGERHPNYGKPCSEETRRKISNSLRGRSHSEERRRRESEAHRGKTHSTGTRREMSESRRGKTHSVETRRKISESHKEYWAARRRVEAEMKHAD